MNPKIRNANRLQVAAASAFVMSVSFFPTWSSHLEIASVSDSSTSPRPISPPRCIVPVTMTAGISAEFEQRFSSLLKESLPKPNEKSFVLQSCDGGKKVCDIERMSAAELVCDGADEEIACCFGLSESTFEHELNAVVSMCPNADVLPAQVISTWLAAFVSWLFVRVRKRRSLILRSKAPGNT